MLWYTCTGARSGLLASSSGGWTKKYISRQTSKGLTRLRMPCMLVHQRFGGGPVKNDANHLRLCSAQWHKVHTGHICSPD
jgi:hypothetical protein